MLNWIKLSVGAVVVGIVLAFHYNTVKEAKEEVRAEYTLAFKEQERKALEAEGELLIKSQIETDKKNEEIARITEYADSLVVSLSHRPTRSQQNTSTTPIESSCTGRELYKEDGEFLVREAARAEKLIVERNYYYEEYENARRKLKELSNE